jgi:hypothetical protein
MPTIKDFRDYIRREKGKRCPPHGGLKYEGLRKMAMEMGFADAEKAKADRRKAKLVAGAAKIAAEHEREHARWVAKQRAEHAAKKKKPKDDSGMPELVPLKDAPAKKKPLAHKRKKKMEAAIAKFKAVNKMVKPAQQAWFDATAKAFDDGDLSGITRGKPMIDAINRAQKSADAEDEAEKVYRALQAKSKSLLAKVDKVDLAMKKAKAVKAAK